MASPALTATTTVIVVHQAETGRTFHLPVGGGAAEVSIGALQAALDPATGVPQAHQILILDGLKLEEDRALSEYDLPAANKPVFLFSRRSLSRNASSHSLGLWLLLPGTQPLAEGMKWPDTKENRWSTKECVNRSRAPRGASPLCARIFSRKLTFM